MKKLTPSKEHYIKAIYTLSSADEGARISDIAERLSVSKASVCTAMDSLLELGLIERDSEHLVLLTTEGRRQADLITDKFVVIKKFLTKVLHVGEKTANTDACALEHVVSEETLLNMSDYIENKCD